MRLLVSVLIGLGVCVLVAAIALRFFHSRGVAKIEEAYAAARIESAGGRFDVASLEALPPPARRWLAFAIADGTPLAGSVELEFTGRLRLSPDTPWEEARSSHVVAADRYVWRSAIDSNEIELDANELYAGGRGEIRLWMHGFLPSGGDGQDLDRSLRGRLVLDRIFLPTSLLPGPNVRWEPIDDARATAAVEIDGESIRLEVTVADDGALVAAKVRRWSHRTSDGVHAEVPYGVTVLSHREVDGRRLPAAARFAWWHGTDREEPFFEPILESATFR